VARTGDGAPGTPGWRVRVVPNLYPIVGGPDARPGATGAHEVVVLSPAHATSFAQLAEEQAIEVFTVLRDRARHHLTAGHAFVQISINHGRAAGASIEHPHAQVVALDVVPAATEQAVARFRAAGHDLVAADLAAAAGSLLVADGPAPVWCPPAPGTPYEMRVALRSSRASFEQVEAPIGTVALAAREALARLAGAIGDVPYNVVVVSAPPGTGPDAFHWYVEIQTRVAIPAGFELGTGILVNTTPPEVAALRLRDAAGGERITTTRP
jgi:UDPglucose--hexose-1-phosphate uridylyltransferase